MPSLMAESAKARAAGSDVAVATGRPSTALPVDERFVLVPDALEDAAAHRQFALDVDAARFLGWTVEEVSYVVLPQLRRAGLATKALCRALDWAAEEVRG